MLVSLKNIKEFVSLDGLTSEEIAKGLTFAGVEVEQISKMASGTNLIIGEILECVNHPDSDHLHVLKVNLGEKYGVEQIVCGAPNARAGLKVIVARLGAKLPEVEIKPAKVRGIDSNGMCCSLLELGVDSKYLSECQTKGIEELPNDAPVGEENVLSYLGLDDEVLNLNVLANRPDLLSIYNVAREIGAIFNREVNIPTFEDKETFKTKFTVGSMTNRCSQFSGKEVKSIVTKPSPLWMQKYLNAMGVRSINNIVDIGNFVMLMTGQPLHMYDADKLAKQELTAIDNYEGDFVALDEKTYSVKNNDIVIACDRKPVCLGGVMGSLACAVDENTKNIFIESASFDGASVRRTSNRLGLASESSQRFVKGTNHFQYVNVLNYVSDLLEKYADAKEFSNIVTYQSEESVDKQISTSVEKINGRLGTSFSLAQIKDALERLHFRVRMNSQTGFFVAGVPSWRLDVTCDADLSEEVIRLLGFENVKSILPVLDVKVGSLSERQTRLKQIRYLLLDKGLDECLTYSLLSRRECGAFNLLHNEESYVILNPLTDDKVVFRTHILHSLLKVATYNVARQNKDLALFETSNMQSKSTVTEHIAVVLVGNQELRGGMSTVPYDFYHMKGLLESIMTILGIENSRYKLERITSHTDELHPGKSAEIIFQNKVIGMMGELHPNKLKEYDLGKTSTVVLELDLDALLSAKIGVTKMAAISRFPTVTRDLAFVVNENVMARDIIKTIKVTGRGLVSSANIFDVYQGQGVEIGKKSIAISISYKSDDHTLLEKEVSDMEDKIKFELTKSYHAELRG